MDVEIFERFERAVREDGRYPPQAFEFLQRGLELATRLRYGEEEPHQPRHVTGRELAQALRVLALRTWGPLARLVLKRWNIHCTRDFGEMVYLMIKIGLMGKQSGDDVADFNDVYDFDEAFGRYEIPIDTVQD